MRLLSQLVLSLCTLSACGDDQADGPTACEAGPSIVSEAIRSLLASEPPCARDADCVSVSFDVACGGYSTVSCNEIVHRDTAARWNAAAVCKHIDDVTVASNYSCSTLAACLGPGVPTCRAGKCTGTER
ncbi:MAG: hypothetical protein JWN04_888 [Myxococcaceae bacterium]|nr:hypothetical protein [Myxococcaceae bacterium]